MTHCDIICGDCLAELRKLPAESVQCCVTDPPYGLSFMGKEWDRGTPGAPYWAEVLRVCKPGAHLLAFGGTRTFHRLACAIEDAGWEIRDTMMWVYGSGFPKSLDVSKAIDKAAGVEAATSYIPQATNKVFGDGKGKAAGVDRTPGAKLSSAPVTDSAREWSGWGTALKPAWEPIILARKPLDGTVAQNVQKHGCGALNIDGCRVAVDVEADASQLRTMNRGQRTEDTHGQEWGLSKNGSDVPQVVKPEGRWPANVIHDGSPEVLAVFPETPGALMPVKGTEPSSAAVGTRCFNAMARTANSEPRDSSPSSAARFFYCAKADSDERAGGNHPTVKPLALMKYLIQLVSRPGDTVLDPFGGSGTTGEAAQELGRNAILIELNPAYCELIRRRTAQAGMILP